jgi:DNA (cytosine-5)-methyltransferase 1
MAKKSTNNQSTKVLDLFSGCGGLSLGFMQAGYDVVAAVDNWSDAINTFKHNHPNAKGLLLDLGNFNPQKFSEEIGRIDVIVGGPPCQGFSISGKRNPKDPRNQLYSGFVALVECLKPKAFVMENVPNLIAMAEGKILNKIKSDFKKLGYHLSYKVLLASDYGVPQNRKRVFFVGLKNSDIFSFPVGTHAQSHLKITTKQAISDLPEKTLVNGSEYPFVSNSDYQKNIKKGSTGIFNHEITKHDPKTISIISMVPDGCNYKSLPEKYKHTRKVNIAWTRFASHKPSPTIDTGHRHHFHYKYNRVPTVRESARLQSFPDNFIFLGTKTSQYKQVGNAVPPMLAKVIAEQLKDYIIR